MINSTPAFDLGALSAKLREDDEQFRRTFALGQLVADPGGAAFEEPAAVVRTPMMSASGPEMRARLLALVEARIGIDAGTCAERADRLLAGMVPAAVPAWLSALETEATDSPVWEALIGTLTVNETYFFRDIDQLSYIRQQVLVGWIAARQREPRVRLACWCAGCASGEEVYSLAMVIIEALRAAGEADIGSDGRILIHPRWRISVLGTDLDRAVLRDAALGRYADFPMGPFRSLPDAFAGYFDTLPAERSSASPMRVVRPEVRALTSFRPFNLADTEPPVFDVNLVLCRNVLIYLSERTRTQTQALFHRALASDGTLALGPTDVLRQPEMFLPLWGPGTVLYRKR